jgi:hypothetical protein
MYAAACAQSPVSTELAMKDTRLAFSVDTEGVPRYAVYFKDRPVILPSSLGFVLRDEATPLTRFRVAGMEKSEKDTTWHPVWGQERSVRDHYRQLTLHLVEKEAPYHRMDLEFRVFAHGIGFRYVFPKQAGLRYFIVSHERTRFNMAEDAKTFWIPGDYDTNEYPYTTSLLSRVNNTHMVNTSTAIAVRVAPDPYAVQTPLMMKTPAGLYINIHEAALVNYPAMQLHVDTARLSLVSSLVPDAVGNMAYLKAPCHTPWRTIIVSDKATDILASRMILNLNDPSKITNTSWIKPMKFVGVWWAMQTGLKAWNYSDYPDSLSAQGTLIPNGRHGATTANVKRYIDFAAKYGFGGVLVEGWDTGWEDWFGHWKENVFDFVTPYPDFDVREITCYAAAKGVKMIMHNETSGAATTYERQMDTAFRFMKKFGYSAVKTGYVGRIIPRGEHHDGQWMVNHYLRVAAKAAGYHIMLDAHEPVRPTGLQRTYPNWMASEAARGNEYNAFSKGNPPEHETILPFTRLMGGPMDYTPGIFKLRYYSTDSTRRVHTTLAKQLALYVTLYSPLQMVSDLPENYLAHMDAFQFIRDVPCDWDQTRYIEAEPGDYLTTARKQKGTENWYIGAITDEHARKTRIPLSFLNPGTRYKATVYEDGADADWKSNPESYRIKHLEVDRSSVLDIALAPGGGAAVEIVPVTDSRKSQVAVTTHAKRTGF